MTFNAEGDEDFWKTFYILGKIDSINFGEVDNIDFQEVDC